MPVYEARCDECDFVVDYTRRIADANETPECPRCGAHTTKGIFTAPTGFVRGKFEPFRSVVDGSLISSQRSMDEHNKRNNVVCLADGYDDATIKAGNFGRKESKLDKKELAADIQQAIHEVQNGYKPVIGEADE